MQKNSVEDSSSVPPARVIVKRQVLATGDLSVLVATEDVRAPTDWSFEESHHTLVVHLEGNLQKMETVFSRGPSSKVLPSIGDIWVIPAGCEYSALAQGDAVRFAEYSVPVDLLGGGDLTARIAYRDPFLHQASLRVAALADRDDDLARMALKSLLEALRFHIADTCLGASGRLAGADDARRFSNRQKQRLIEYIEASMHGTMDTQGMAAAAGVSGGRLVEGFKASFGMTPWQYVLRARLAEACRQLREGDASITSISAATGFSSPSHLATAFRKHLGMSPAAYRRTPRDRDRLAA